jgi:lysozyme
LKNKYWKIFLLSFTAILIVIAFIYKNYLHTLVPFSSSNYKIRGIDISHYNQIYNWDLVKSKNSFCIMKATEGNTINDRRFKASWDISKKLNITRGAYHFFKSNSSASVQFENYRNSVKLVANDLPPILDVENADINMKDVNLWLEMAEKYYGVKPIIYSSYYFFVRYMKGKVNNYPVWLYYNTKYKLRPAFDTNEVFFYNIVNMGKLMAFMETLT